MNIFPKYKKQQTKAYSLLETVVSLSIGSILLLSLGSTIVIMSKAIPQSTSAASVRNVSTRVIYDIVRNVESAKQVTIAEKYNFTFIVDDRNGNGSDDTIVYIYDVDAKTLSISFNGAASKVIEEDLYDFTFDYNTISEKDITRKITDVKITYQKIASLDARVIRTFRLVNKPKVK